MAMCDFEIRKSMDDESKNKSCSAKSLKNISEMFYYAQKAVLHPTAPIFMHEKQDLTEECKKALTRIFMVCDLDNDGLLNDYELNAFQKRCFDMPLRPEAMEEVKEVLRRNISGGVSPNNCITLQGFLYLHCLIVQRGQSHTTWTVLRKFGYNDQLHLTKDFLFPQLKLPSGSSAELSHKGSQFFTKLFRRFDKDKDGALSPLELTQLFSTCSTPAWGNDMKYLVPTNEKEWITLPGFLCFWSFTTVTDVKTTFEYLAYFGYPINECENQLSAIQVTREKKLDILKKQSTRNVYQCHVIGMRGVGKSMISRRILDHSVELIKESCDGLQKSVNIVHVYGQEKFLIMKEIEVRNLSDPLISADTKCDVACLVYDCANPKSFEFVARIYLKYFEKLKTPVLFVGSKGDLTEVKQDYLVQPVAFCDAHRLAPPHKFSAFADNYRDVYQKLATMAAFPHLTELSLLNSDSFFVKAGIGLAIVAALGLVVSKLLKA